MTHPGTWVAGPSSNSKLEVTFLSLLLQAGELQGCTAARLLRGSWIPFLSFLFKDTQDIFILPVSLRAQRKNQKLQRFGEVMGESVFDYFYFNA